ncbi:molybdenum cofactor biosynthesis protein B [Halohasta litchfieldiae]|jgi:molybdenum cofactor biosynthesis protein B|uniref:Molybdenum cofactor biosynthesis protein B n=1 Tax=Halohasta litchfieldiae TaxID=1073996 RepID=A0A1H6X8G5_9EURY|nr:molybdenum cofactor biosynthesis protein B [Halohasta litchfieldiae]ATW90098.1 molybdenum cofactor biosynthesis protein B [Halohasta litchfieldiae]SEJ20835.1 molybdenum cofactor biosynthesis protein B [Halohasta litchfieldiae]
MPETPSDPDRTATTDSARRTTDDHGHDIVSPLQAAIITVSTSRANATDPEDPGGDRIESLLEAADHRVVDRRLVPDGIGPIQRALDELLDDPTVDFVIATGGTGATIDDVTPDAVSERFDRELPGFGELFRQLSYEEIGPRTIASRATAGIARDTPVFVLPGSRNAVELATEAIILDEAPHLVGLSTRHLVGPNSE